MSELLSCTACGLTDAPYYDANGLCPLCSPEFDNRRAHIDKQNGRNQAVDSHTTCNVNDSPSELQRRALEAIATYGGIRPAARAIGEQLGEKINHGVIGLAAKGKDFPKARHVLGLLANPIPVYPCPDCGKIHKQLKTCKPGRKPGKVRFSVWVTEDERDQLRAATDSHPHGRAACLLENVIRGRAKP